MISFCSFEGVRYFFVELSIFFFQVTLCNKPVVVLRHWKRYGTGICKTYSTPNMNYWAIGFSAVTYIELWWSVKDLQKNALKILGTRSPVGILASSDFFFNFIFSALIDNPNNFEIVRAARLVVSGIFLLQSSASLIFFLHFDLIPSKPSLKWTLFWNGHLLQQTRCFIAVPH